MEAAAASTSANLCKPISLKPLPYSLDCECPVPWPSSQEDAINQDYPFHRIDTESPEELVIRRYLETLWLPESIMPLHHFVKSLRRLVSSSDILHATLKPLLLSVRATQDKYHQVLPQILQDGGGEGEIEETIMWYAWGKEKFELDERGENSDAGAEDAWRKAWMEKLERREVQIQILLYFHLLSLPPPTPTTPVASQPKKRKRRQPHGPPSPVKPAFPPTSTLEAAAVASRANTPAQPTKSSTVGVDESLSLEDRLEFFMDRLSLWQLVTSLNPPGSSQPISSQPMANEQRDWMQIFCEDVVELLFKDRLPELCTLLRTKVFPHSPFADDSDGGSSPPPPDLRVTTTIKARGKRPASPLRLEELEKRKVTQGRATSIQPADSWESGAQQGNRSRSRSVSVSVEEVRARGASRGGVASSKNLFKGEVEMKRTVSRGSNLFKPPASEKQMGISRELTHQNSRGDTIPSFEPLARTSQPRSPSQLREPKTLAIDTPVKKLLKSEDSMPDIVMDSPDEILLKSQAKWEQMDEDEDGVSLAPSIDFVADTPVKRRLRG